MVYLWLIICFRVMRQPTVPRLLATLVILVVGGVSLRKVFLALRQVFLINRRRVRETSSNYSSNCLTNNRA